MNATDWASLLFDIAVWGGLTYIFYFFTNRVFERAGWKGVWKHLCDSMGDLLFELTVDSLN